MLNLANELDSIRRVLNDAGIEYAVCGGIALTIHGFTRSTVDIDLFVQGEDVERIYTAVEAMGYTFRARPMTFSGGAMEIRRVTKIDPTDGDTMVLDLLLVTPQTKHVWETRQVLTFLGKPVTVVSREGLITLKRFRSSDQDLVDIRRLESGE